jgi:LacI family transcriptional regulator
MTGRRLSRILVSRGIEGVLIPLLKKRSGHISMQWNHFAVVSLGFTLLAPRFHGVGKNENHNFTLALRKGLHAGYRRIALVLRQDTDDNADKVLTSRFCLYQQGIAEKHRVPLFCYKDRSPEFSQRHFSSWFKKYKPDFLLTEGPYVCEWLAALGIAVPQTVSVVDMDLQRFDGSLAGVNSNAEIVGAEGVNLLVRQIESNLLGVPKHPISTLIEGSWQEGNSLLKKVITSRKRRVSS